MYVSRCLMVLVGWGVWLGGAVAVEASSAVLSLVNPGPGTVLSGTAVTLEVQATFDTRLSAVAFELSASGAGEALMTARSLNPVGSNGLTYVSQISQSPFDDNLPHDLKASPLLEAAYDNDFDLVPGGASDGLAPGTGVLMESITVVLTISGSSGTVDLSLSNVSAAHTTGPPDGKLFDLMGVGLGTVQLTVTVPGDVDGDGDIDLGDYTTFPGCMTGPEGGPVSAGCEVFDFNIDDDVDLEDFAGFQLDFTG